MDNSVLREFLSSGKTLITDTMSPKSVLPKVSKEMKTVAPQQLNPLENLIKRCKDEKVSKMELIEVYLKIIEQQEALI